MSVSQSVIKRVENKKSGELITFDEFSYLKNFNAVALTLGRLKKNGKIERLSKGIYYKPTITEYGNLKPSEDEILKRILLKNNKGYVSGAVAFNKLGLTSQVPNTIEIRGNNSSRFAKIGKLRIKYKKSDDEFRTEDVQVLQLLDALQEIRKIADTNCSDAYIEIKSRMLKLSEDEIKRLFYFTKNRKPCVRALVGSILEKKFPEMAQSLLKTLNSLTTYKLGIDESVLLNMKKWKIK
jgi:predicted transcriptional regulator of viral defense system